MSEDQVNINEEKLLDQIRKLVSEGKDIRTRFDEFWEAGVSMLENNIRTVMGISDDKQVANLLSFANGVSRMTWAAHLSILAASFEQMAGMEVAVTQVRSESSPDDEPKDVEN